MHRAMAALPKAIGPFVHLGDGCDDPVPATMDCHNNTLNVQRRYQDLTLDKKCDNFFMEWQP